MGARLLVHKSIFKEVVEKFAAKAKSIRCGPPQDPATQMGPVISAAQLARVCTHMYTYVHMCRCHTGAHG